MRRSFLSLRHHRHFSADYAHHPLHHPCRRLLGKSLAPFHPDFQFEGTDSDDIGNYTNRSPYPTLHLIREDSIAKAAQAFPDASAIFERNIALLEKMGHEGWDKLDIPRCPFDHGKTKASE